MERQTKLPELLAPAGSFEALLAAVEAGADAVYFGGGVFHARALAKNFDRDEIKRAILYLHLFHVKAYITLNTLLFDREYQQALDEAKFLYESGADGFICADVGLINAIRKHIPHIPIHVSTQAFVHNREGAEVFYGMGAERVVVARELSKENIASIIKDSPTEVEVFVHGAICVCHSGQCLFSSAVGGRSGNRGLCAQPCRLPYGKDYTLSLQDMCLAKHIPWFVESGVASLKIEGRMKSPTYVYAVTKLYRQLLNENRPATEHETEQLKRVFCRGDKFSDHYFAGKPLIGMTGVRTEKEKALSREMDTETFQPKKLRIKAKIEILPETPSKITLTMGEKTATAYGAVPAPAQNAPLTAEGVKERMAKLGDSFFCLEKEDIALCLGEGLFLTAGQQNELRRSGVKALEMLFTQPHTKSEAELLRLSNIDSTQEAVLSAQSSTTRGKRPTAVFYHGEVLKTLQKGVKDRFSVLYVPLEQWQKELGANGVALPPAVFDSQWDDVDKMLAKAKAEGALYALVSGLAQIGHVKKQGLIPMGDLRCNITSKATKAVLQSQGIADSVLSPELTLPQARDVGGRVVLYGRLPLMLLERCIMREKDGCENCEKRPLVDRTNTAFPVFRSYPHRNLLFNAHPTYMGDKKQVLASAGLTDYHFIFTTETPKEIEEIVLSAEKGQPLKGRVKRFPGEKV